MKSLSILGSTGSIGTQALEVVDALGSDYNVVGLSTNQNIALLEQQIKKYHPVAVAVFDKGRADVLKERLEKQKMGVPVYSGIEGLNKLATLSEADTVVTAVVGNIGLLPTINAIKAKKNIALANKETLVCGGHLIMDAVKKNKVSLMPIDSEHSAIFQCLNGENRKEVRKIILTCSGGAFRGKTKAELVHMKAKDALKHPTWNMGSKITIDSATLMNKGLEVIEAHWLFGVDYKDIEVVLHPQSIIHSMVEFIDSSTIAQLGLPSMKLPIQYALAYPERKKAVVAAPDLVKIKELSFSYPDMETFSCLCHAYAAGMKGGSMPTAMNAANEVLVDAFLKDKIGFLDIADNIKKVMDNHNMIKNPDVDDILDVDKKIREETKRLF